ncbi:hypothetical protein MMC13_002565 [Lambiella insularis]|nr:hypothetical protein [Lambiella insularis]
MAEGLPEGLVTNSGTISGDIQGVDHIAPEDLAHLWRVYTTNRNLLANHVGRRLENFFWRIWSNKNIRDNIRGSQVALIFTAISDGDVVIRTTPTSSPRASRLLPTWRTGRPSDTADNAPQQKSTDSGIGGIDERLEAVVAQENVVPKVSQPPTIEEEKGRRRGPSRPPPILKKTRTDSATQQSKSARILTPNWKTPRRENRPDNFSPRPSSSISFGPDVEEDKHHLQEGLDDVEPLSSPTSAEATFTLPQATPLDPSKPSTGSNTKPTKKKSAFVASSTSGKRRPTIAHRKSSQSSSSSASKAASPRLGSHTSAYASPPPVPPIASLRPEGAQLVSPEPEGRSKSKLISKAPSSPTRRPTSRSASPVSSGPFHRPTRDHLPGRVDPGPTKESQEKGQQEWLVDRDFRSKFFDRPKAEHQLFAPFPARTDTTLRMSTSVQGHGTFDLEPRDTSTEKGKGKAKQPAATANSKMPSEIAGTSGTADAGAESIQELPRTKSHLTLLLEKDRKSENEKSKKKGKQKKRDSK